MPDEDSSLIEEFIDFDLIDTITLKCIACERMHPSDAYTRNILLQAQHNDYQWIPN